jgi:hypothetical protein
MLGHRRRDGLVSNVTRPPTGLRDAAIKVVNLSTSQPVLLPSGSMSGTDQPLTLKSPNSWLDRHWFGALLLHAILLQAIAFLPRPMTSYRAIELGAQVFWLGARSVCFALVPCSSRSRADEPRTNSASAWSSSPAPWS